MYELPATSPGRLQWHSRTRHITLLRANVQKNSSTRCHQRGSLCRRAGVVYIHGSAFCFEMPLERRGRRREEEKREKLQDILYEAQRQESFGCYIPTALNKQAQGSRHSRSSLKTQSIYLAAYAHTDLALNIQDLALTTPGSRVLHHHSKPQRNRFPRFPTRGRHTGKDPHRVPTDASVGLHEGDAQRLLQDPWSLQSYHEVQLQLSHLCSEVSRASSKIQALNPRLCPPQHRFHSQPLFRRIRKKNPVLPPATHTHRHTERLC